MQLSPVLLFCAAALATFGVSQTLAPTAQAQAVPAAPALRVCVQSLHAKQTAGGIEVTGRILNTGRQALIYPAVVFIFTDAAGTEMEHADGYLLAGPVAPGQSAGFRAAAPPLPAFAQVTLRLREAGRTVTVQPRLQSASRRTTAW